MRKSNLIGLYGVQVLNLLLPVLTLPTLVQSLNGEAFGTMQWIFASTMLLVVLVDAGLPSVTLRQIAHARHKQSRFVNHLFSACQLVRLSMAIALISASSVAWWIWQPRGIPVALFLIACLNVLGTLALPAYCFVATQRGVLLAVMHLVGRVAVTIFIVTFVKEPSDLGLALAFQCSSTLISGIVMHAYARDLGMPTYVMPRATIRRALLSRAVSVGPLDFLVAALALLPTIAIGALISTAAAGAYSLADRIARLGFACVAPVIQSLGPKATRATLDIRKRNVSLVATMGAVIGVVLALFAPIIIDLIAGVGYSEKKVAIFCLRVLGLWTFSFILTKSIADLVFIGSGNAYILSKVLTPIYLSQAVGVIFIAAIAPVGWMPIAAFAMETVAAFIVYITARKETLL